MSRLIGLTFRIALVTLGLVCGTAEAFAQVVVTNLNDSGPGSLREAIVIAPSGSTITFAVTGTIEFSFHYGPLTIDKNLTINGPGASNLAISGHFGTTVF